MDHYGGACVGRFGDIEGAVSGVAKKVNTIIIGLGQTGFACARYFKRVGEPFAVVDTRQSPPFLNDLKALMPDVDIHLGTFNAKLFRQVSRLVISPGVALTEPAIQQAAAAGVELIGDIELFVREAKAPILAVTGSNGKTSVVSLLGEMASHAGRKAAIGGNIGTPALDLLNQEAVDFYVLELSSFQLETTFSLQAHAAVVLNISEDHMDRYQGLNHYAETKLSIYKNASVAVVNQESSYAPLIPRSDSQTVIHYALTPPATENDYGIVEGTSGTHWFVRGKNTLCPVEILRTPGRHNQSNALAALALGAQVGLPDEAMCAALKSFKGLPHRMEVVAEQEDVVWYNDSKATNPGATAAALSGMTRKAVLIAGGEAKGADFDDLKPLVAEHTQAVILLGKDAEKLEASWKGTVPLYRVGTMREAVIKAHAIVQPGDCVLLSPACASLDQYRNFEARGDDFSRLVKEVLS